MQQWVDQLKTCETEESFLTTYQSFLDTTWETVANRDDQAKHLGNLARNPNSTSQNPTSLSILRHGVRLFRCSRTSRAISQ